MNTMWERSSNAFIYCRGLTSSYVTRLRSCNFVVKRIAICGIRYLRFRLLILRISLSQNRYAVLRDML
ncbi:hypothetical protein GGE67_004039 [Rhizobium leucaenae]|uniref:Uncharacterized protein n=1 Tax=Rhizobium leucaenae TaxID=29450 RepID=A0A7W6ZYH5_9HYPH|nr:hypothetical protein [Rhizobium leucaenae]MBB6303407.1 hypothetical protein [Rhizobium leucaenae]